MMRLISLVLHNIYGIRNENFVTFDTSLLDIRPVHNERTDCSTIGIDTKLDKNNGDEDEKQDNAKQGEDDGYSGGNDSTDSTDSDSSIDLNDSLANEVRN